VPDLPRSHLVAYVVAGLLLVFAGARWVHASSARTTGTGHVRGSAPAVRLERSDRDAVVHVAGAVRRAGLYRLAAGARVADAVRRAGGATRHADLEALNLAAKVEDGRQVVVPRRAPAVPAGSVTAPAGDDTGANAAPVDLNTATAEELGTLDGVGPATARKIMEYRRQHGGFGTVDELDQVPGIGEKRLAALRPHVRV
jgi:competence protein ComEA